MTDISTKYMGLELRSPLVVSSNPLCRKVENIKQMEDAGAGAVVLPSLFEEQIILQQHERAVGFTEDSALPPALQHLPNLQEYNRGADDYLVSIYEAKNAVDMPVIASLNGTSAGGWVDYARLLSSAGADAIELNIYYLPTSIDTSGYEIEERFVRLVGDIKTHVPIPLAVKLNPYFSSIPNIAAQLAHSKADGLVLFNRFYQPDFDLENETVVPSLDLSDSAELRLRLRWIAILYGHVDIDLAVTGGVHTSSDAIKAIFAGASVVMMASALLERGIDHLGSVHLDLHSWMNTHQYTTLDEMRGRMSYRNVSAPAAIERANYIDELQSYPYPQTQNPS